MAKYFDCKSLANAYPLFKTLKLTEEVLHRTHVTEIPVRLLQFTGQITTSRVTAMIESILESVAKKYCQEHINEFCRDSEHYLEELDQWKTKNIECISDKRQKSELFIVAADVVSLYPNINKQVLRSALMDALQNNSDFSTPSILAFIAPILLKLEGVITRFRNNFFKQIKGIITGDNHSVSNIVTHFALQPAADKLQDTELFKRFINDILWLSFG